MSNKNNAFKQDSFIIYNSQYEPVRSFSNEDLGKLFHTIFKYHLEEEIGELEDKILVAFEFYKVQFGYDYDKRKKIIEARTESGRLGGLAKKANANFAKQNKQSLANLAINVNDNENGNGNGNDNDNGNDDDCDINKEAVPSNEVKLILEDLNKRIKSKKGFSPLAQCNQDLINARISEGFTVENFITVNEKKVKQWLNDPEMSKFLRPSTLYGDKFDGYLNEIVCELPANQSNSFSNIKYPTADERARENSKWLHDEILRIRNEQKDGGDSVQGTYQIIEGFLEEDN